jgi:hypothetical protein
VLGGKECVSASDRAYAEIRDRRSDGDRASIGFQAFVMVAVIPKVACAMPSQRAAKRCT